MNLQKIQQLFQMDLKYKESLIFYFSIFTLFLFPIINNDLPYRDDQVRIIRGNDWAFLGRNMADVIMHILTFSYNKLSNISPLTFILSITIISFTLSNFIHKSKLNKCLVNHINLSLLFISPFYLQNMSYQYDNLTMNIGFCLVLTSYIQNWDNKKNIFTSISLLTAGIFFFQPVSNIFITLVFFNNFINLKDKSKNLENLIKGIIIYSLSLIIYYIMFKYFFSLDSSNRAEMIHIKELPETIISALSILSNFLKSFLYSPILIFLGISLIVFVVSFIFNILKHKENLLIKIIKLSSPIFILLFIWGPFIMLEETFARPREFVTIGLIISGILLYNNENNKKLSLFNIIITSLIFTFCFSLSYQYSNLSKQEYSYDNMLTDWISKDINSNKELYSKRLVYLNSHPDYAPGSKIILENQPFLQYIQMPYYNWFSRFYLENRGVKNIYKDLTNVDDKYDWNSICIKKDAKLVIENKYYNIYLINNPTLIKEISNHVSVWFKRSDNICHDRPNIDFTRNLFFIEDPKI